MARKNGLWHTDSAYHVFTTGTTQTCHEWLLKLLQLRSSGQSSIPISTLLLRSPSQLPCLRSSSCTRKVRSLQDTRSTALKGTACLASPSVQLCAHLQSPTSRTIIFPIHLAIINWDGCGENCQELKKWGNWCRSTLSTPGVIVPSLVGQYSPTSPLH